MFDYFSLRSLILTEPNQQPGSERESMVGLYRDLTLCNFDKDQLMHEDSNSDGDKGFAFKPLTNKGYICVK